MKTLEQYKEEFIKRASTGFLLLIWQHRKRGDGYSEIPPPVRAVDAIWSKEDGKTRKHTWTEEEFKTILDSRNHWPRKRESRKKRQLLAKQKK